MSPNFVLITALGAFPPAPSAASTTPAAGSHAVSINKPTAIPKRSIRPRISASSLHISTCFVSYHASTAVTGSFLKGLLRCRLFRLFLAATRAAPNHFAVDGDFYLKELVVIRSRLSNDRIGRQTVEAPLTPFLHLSFIVPFTGPMSVAGDLRQLE